MVVVLIVHGRDLAFFKGIPSYFFLFLKKIVHDPTKNKLYYLIV